MFKSAIYLRWTRSACFVGLVAVAIALAPSRAVALDNRALIGGIVGMAAAAMIANGIANAQRVRPSVHVAHRHRKPAPTAHAEETAQSGSDPFAGVAASKVRPVSGN
jgi:hypothetical protein